MKTNRLCVFVKAHDHIDNRALKYVKAVIAGLDPESSCFVNNGSIFLIKL